MRIVISGPPGVGKGTRAAIISKELGIPHISTGDLFRKEIQEGTEIGKQIEDFVKKGQLVPDEITLNLLKKRLQQDDCKKGFILDGFPRTLKQAEMLKEITNIDVFLNLIAENHVLVERISSRRTCNKCNAIFNIKTLAPQREGICDFCSGSLYQREDEKPEVVKERLKIYEEKTKSVLAFYKALNLLEELDGTLDINDPNFREQLFKRLRINF